MTPDDSLASRQSQTRLGQGTGEFRLDSSGVHVVVEHESVQKSFLHTLILVGVGFPAT